MRILFSVLLLVGCGKAELKDAKPAAGIAAPTTIQSSQLWDGPCTPLPSNYCGSALIVSGAPIEGTDAISIDPTGSTNAVWCVQSPLSSLMMHSSPWDWPTLCAGSVNSPACHNAFCLTH